MVLQTEQYNGGYKHQTYSAYQGPAGGYNNFQGVTDYTSPYPGPFQASTYPSSHGPHHQPGWSSGGDFYGSGAGHYPSGGMVAPVKISSNGYDSSCYENSYTHGNSNNHGSPHHKGHGSPNHQGHGNSHDSYGHGHGNSHSSYGQGHGNSHSSYGQGYGSPHNQGHNNPYGPGKPNGITGVITTKINKLTHGNNKYGSGSPNYGPNPNGFNHGGYPQPQTWIVKGIDDDE